MISTKLICKANTNGRNNIASCCLSILKTKKTTNLRLTAHQQLAINSNSNTIKTAERNTKYKLHHGRRDQFEREIEKMKPISPISSRPFKTSKEKKQPTNHPTNNNMQTVQLSLKCLSPCSRCYFCCGCCRWYWLVLLLLLLLFGKTKIPKKKHKICVFVALSPFYSVLLS